MPVLMRGAQSALLPNFGAPITPAAWQATQTCPYSFLPAARSAGLPGAGWPAEAVAAGLAAEIAAIAAAAAFVSALAADAGPPSETVIGVGTTVTVRFGDGAEQTVHIGEVADALDQNLVTSDSPLGRALLGHHAGDEVAYDAPDGHTTARIVSLG